MHRFNTFCQFLLTMKSTRCEGLEWKYDFEFLTLLGFNLGSFPEEADDGDISSADAVDDLGRECGRCMGVEIWLVVDMSAPIVNCVLLYRILSYCALLYPIVFYCPVLIFIKDGDGPSI